MSEERNFGTQPLANLLKEWGLSHRDLVEASPEQLTHKQMVRACGGRRLTLKMMMKVARTLNFAIWGRLSNSEREAFAEYLPKQLFNYSKNWDAEAKDPNEPLYGKTQGRNLREDFKEELGKV